MPPIDHVVRVRAIVRRVMSRPKYETWQDCGWVQVYGQLSLGLVRAVIHLQFWAYGSWDSLYLISMSPNCKLTSPEHIFSL